MVRQVVRILRDKGLRVATIKSSHQQSITFDSPGSDTSLHREAGAETVALLAPDQMVIIGANPGRKLADIVHRFFPECDIVIGEGFKDERHIVKIEVTRESGNLLRDQVSGVVAVITDQPVAGDNIFRTDQAEEVAEFIITRYLQDEEGEFATLLYVDGRKVPLKGFVQEALGGTVQGFIRTLKQTGEMRNIELNIRVKKKRS